MGNIFTERLWRTVKYEHVYLSDHETPRAVRQGLTDYLEFYDLDRPHQALGYRTPAEVYFDADLAAPRPELRPELRPIRPVTPPEHLVANRLAN